MYLSQSESKSGKVQASPGPSALGMQLPSFDSRWRSCGLPPWKDSSIHPPALSWAGYKTLLRNTNVCIMHAYY